MSTLIKQKKVWIPGVLAILLGLYAIAGFVWAPKLIRGAVIDGIHKSLGLTAAVGEIHLNPFTLELEVKNFALPDRSGAKLLGFDRLFVDFEVSSLWHRAFVFQDIEIDAPYAYAVVSPDGALNMADLKPKSAAPPPPPPTGGKQAEEPLPRIEIGRFSVSRGAAGYEDRSRPDHFAVKLDPINFELRDFTTGAEGGRFRFTGASKLGERVQWQGHLSLQPLESEGEFQLAGVRAQTIWDYIKEQVGFYVNSGTVDLNGDYKFALRERPEFHARLARLSLKDLGIRPDEHAEDWISVPAFTLSAAEVDLGRRSVSIDSAVVDDARFKAWLERDGRVNLASLAKTPPQAGALAPAAAAAPAAPAATAAPAAPAAPWQVSLRQFAINRANIDFQDRSTTPAARFSIVPLNLKVDGISLDMSRPLDVSLDAVINDNGHVAAAGALTPSPLSADLKVDVSGLGLRAIQPYLVQRTAMTLLDGRLNVEGKLHFAAGAGPQGGKSASHPPKPSMQFAGDVSVDKLHTIDNELRKDFISWNRLQIGEIDFRQNPDRLDIDKIVADKLYARVLIEPDRTLNVARILAGPKGLPKEPAAANAGPPAQNAPTAQAPPPQRPAARQPNRHAKAAPPSPPGMPINIRRILIRASDASFTDLSIQPNFSAGIQSLAGTVTGLTSRPGSRAKVDLHGQVDRFSPVAIQGEIGVLGPAMYTDLSLSFRNMELTTFNPYSGKWAGYNISKGKLTTELNYKIDGRKLVAGHHIIIDQLEFGEKTASKDAVTLPIKLAVALLKDRHGVIDLDVPVTGSLDDPQFRLGPIIWKVVKNLLVKIVTSPFALLGSMFGGGPDMQFVDFQPGIATLDAAGQTKVKTIVKALIERPQLKISVPLAPVPDLDRPALISARLDAAVRTEQELKGPHKKSAPGQAQAPPPLESLPAEAQLTLLTAVYRKDIGSKPEFPQPAAAADAASKSDAKAQAIAAKIDYLRQALLKHYSVSDEEIKALAQKRAEAVQQILLADTQIDPARVFLVANGKAKPEAHAVRLELTLE